MALDSKTVLEKIDDAIKTGQNISQVLVGGASIHEGVWGEGRRVQHFGPSDEDVARANLVMLSALKKYAPPSSPYVQQAETVLGRYGPANDYARQQVLGMLRGLRLEYETGALLSVSELVHADLFADFLQMARYQLDKGFKDPAAVLAAGVFEQHLRSLAGKHGITVVKENGDPKGSEAINDELEKAGAYDMGTRKEVTAKLHLRKNAAHGDWSKYDHQQVALFIEWVSFFAQKYPA